MRSTNRRPRPAAKKWDSLKSPKSEKAYASLIRLLYRRDHSEKELRDKLQRWYTPEAVAIAVDLAHARKYIKDPHELAAQTGRALQARGKGRFYVQQALKKKGLPALHLDSEQELANCQELLSRRFHGHDLSQTAVRVKAFRYLTSRGFDSETVNKALKNWRALSQTEEDVAL